MRRVTLRIVGKGWQMVVENLLVRPSLTAQMLLDRVDAPDYSLFIIRGRKRRMLLPEDELYPLLYIRRKNELIAMKIPWGRDFFEHYAVPEVWEVRA
jgi:hypothetical protein